MLLLAKRGLLPTWTLFCFKEVTANADPSYEPNTLAFVSDDAILIHPVRTEVGYKGLLIARECVSMTMQQMTDPSTGEVITLRMPHVHTKVIAEEGAEVRFN